MSVSVLCSQPHTDPAQNCSWLLSGTHNNSKPHSKWMLYSSTTLQNNTRVWLILKLNEMGLHHPITDWYLNGKHTSIKPCRGGRFCLHPPEIWLRGSEGGGMGGFMNKYGLEVCDNSRSEMLSISHSPAFDYHSLNQTKTLLTSTDPTGVFLITLRKWDETKARKNY